MFTGIVHAVGSVTRVERGAGGARVNIDAGALQLRDARVGDSIAVNGVCLTAVQWDRGHFVADVSIETLAATTFAEVAAGVRVNLEPALLAGSPLGGHLVSGHVDGVGTVRAVEPAGDSRRLVIEAPAPLARYITKKGSITVDGVSLTVNAVERATFEINVVPHTLTATTFGDYRPGLRVNLEVDLLARYLERLLARDKE